MFWSFEHVHFWSSSYHLYNLAILLFSHWQRSIMIPCSLSLLFVYILGIWCSHEWVCWDKWTKISLDWKEKSNETYLPWDAWSSCCWRAGMWLSIVSYHLLNFMFYFWMIIRLNLLKKPADFAWFCWLLSESLIFICWWFKKILLFFKHNY